MLYDIWHTPYFHPNGSINPDCKYFEGVHPDIKQRILDSYFNH